MLLLRSPNEDHGVYRISGTRQAGTGPGLYEYSATWNTMRLPADCSISAEMNYTRAEQSILQSARPVLDKDGRPAAHQAALLQSRAGILSAPALTLTPPPRPQLDHKLKLSTRPQRTHKTQNLVYFLYSRLNPACLEFLFSEMNCSERIPVRLPHTRPTPADLPRAGYCYPAPRLTTHFLSIKSLKLLSAGRQHWGK